MAAFFHGPVAACQAASRLRCRAAWARTCAGAVAPKMLRAFCEPRRLTTSDTLPPMQALPHKIIFRSALANERMQTNAVGPVVLKLKSLWRDGSTRLSMPQELEPAVQGRGFGYARAAQGRGMATAPGRRTDRPSSTRRCRRMFTLGPGQGAASGCHGLPRPALCRRRKRCVVSAFGKPLDGLLDASACATRHWPSALIQARPTLLQKGTP